MSWFLLAKYVIGGVGVGLLNISYNSARLMWWWAKIINHCTHFGFAINLPVGANLILRTIAKIEVFVCIRCAKIILKNLMVQISF